MPQVERAAAVAVAKVLLVDDHALLRTGVANIINQEPDLQVVAEATGQSARFVKVVEEYKKAPEVTRKRLYLETMERVFGSADKIIIDSNGVVPLFSLAPRHKTLATPRSGRRRRR